MNLLLYMVFACFILYVLPLVWMARGFIRTKLYTPVATTTELPVTIIVCARNEEKYISLCLNSIVNQEYGRANMQILMIDDASSDSTLKLAEAALQQSGCEYTIISNTEKKGKKTSIAYAMQFARHELIVTRDADTFTSSSKWLTSITSFYIKHPCSMIIAPVALPDKFGLLWALQAFENNILAVLACGSAYYNKPFLCNGANLVFTKKAFIQTDAYASHSHISSGDDVLFLEDIKKVQGSKIIYLKNTDAVVYTYPSNSWRSLLRQKVRWAAKFTVNKNLFNAFLAVISFLVNLAWLYCVAYCFIERTNVFPTLVVVVCKPLLDFLLLILVTGFIKNCKLLWYSLPLGCVYPLYACVVALSSLIIKPKWK